MNKLTIYDLNKEISEQLPPLTEIELTNSKNLVKSFLKNHNEEKYFMLLNHELRYFTLFNNITNSDFTKEVFEIIQDLGQIKTVKYGDDEGNAVEFWIDDNMYLLFPYSKGVVEV